MNAAYRQLLMFQQLLTGQIVRKQALADQFAVDPRVIQRDLSQIRQFMDEQQLFYQMVYKRKLGGYQLATTQDSVSKQSLLVLIKVLLASRSLRKDELDTTINGLLQLMPVPIRKEIDPIIKNEQFHYVEIHHQRPLRQIIWQFSQFILKKQAVQIDYQRQHGEHKHYLILPQAVIFSEYYFYIISYSVTGQGTRFFRADRIRNCHPASEKISRSYADRFEDGILRQHVQYMQPGRTVTLQFEFGGIVEAALDRFPHATVKARYPERGSVLIEAETSEQGAKMWLLSQGALVKVISPTRLVDAMQAELTAMQQRYH